MRNVLALLLSTAIHAAIAAFVWHVSTHLPEKEPKFQPFDLNMLTVEAPPPALPAETVAKNPGMPEAQPAQPAAPPPPPPPPKSEPVAKPEPKPEPKPKEKPKEKKPKDKPKEKVKEKPKEKTREKTKRKKKTEAEPEPEIREAPPRVNIDTAPVTGNPPLLNSNSRQSAPIAQASAPGGAVKGQPSAPRPSAASGGGQDAKRAYQNGLRRAIERNKPRRTSDKGKAVVAFTVESSGAFSNIRLQQSSGNPELDDAALQAVRNTGRYEPPPGGQAMSLAVPIQFQLR